MADKQMAYYGNILKEELKNKVENDLFPDLDTTQFIRCVDFCVSLPTESLDLNETESLPWGDAKKGQAMTSSSHFSLPSMHRKLSSSPTMPPTQSSSPSCAKR